MKTAAFLALAGLVSTTACLAAPTASKPSNVQLTIYNQNFALVREERAMSLDKGMNTIFVGDVAATIEPSSVAFKSLTDPMSVVVREQNYQYDLINPNTILNKSVGKKVKVYDGGKLVEGILLNPATVTVLSSGEYNPYSATQSNGLVVQTQNGIILNASVNQVSELPEGLVSQPTLMWKLESAKSGSQATEVSYIANSITWSADYVAVVDPSDKYIDLTGWVTLTNNSGVTYNNASLNLMAGDVHRVQPQTRYKGANAMMSDAYDISAAPAFTEKSLFEYHLYTLKDKTTVKDKETKQISLMSASRVPAKKLYIYDGRKDWWSSYRYGGYRPGESYDVSANKKVNVLMEITNSKENNLGLPLPKGKIRVYKSEADANQHFVGEDLIDHTPKDEKVRLYLGDAFDVVATHTRTNFKRISDHEVEETFEISLRNHKDAPVTVVDTEHLTSDWAITQSSHKYFKKDASTVEIPVDVPKDGEVKINYTVRTKW